MNDLKLYNTLTKSKVPFKPIEAGKVKIYLCGPTVYDLLHIGNFRGAIFFNLVRSWLEKIGYEVTFVYNYTDVDDKIIKRAASEGVDSSVISERYIAEFEKDFNRLGLKKHTHNPRVTEFMPQIIKFVEDLLIRGVAYEVDGEVFYSILKHQNYGCLSGKKLDELEAGARVDVDPKKKNPFDFVLWKPSKKGEPAWESPWGLGRPGWHIECSAMIQTILGETIDIHGGGIDLIFPHHENEIAQGEGRTGKTYCNHWMHNNFINLKDQKMSKSLGNVITARSFMDRYHPEILKYLMLEVSYRTMLNINEEQIEGALSGLSRIYSALKNADSLTTGTTGIEIGTEIATEIGPEIGPESADKNFTLKIKEANDKIMRALNDDFNSAEVFSPIFEIVRAYNALNLSKKKQNDMSLATSKLFSTWLREQGQMMALFQENPNQFLAQIDAILIRERGIDVDKVEELILKRNQARANKDYHLSDALRDELLNMGVELQDGGADAGPIARARAWRPKI